MPQCRLSAASVPRKKTKVEPEKKTKIEPKRLKSNQKRLKSNQKKAKQELNKTEDQNKDQGTKNNGSLNQVKTPTP